MSSDTQVHFNANGHVMYFAPFNIKIFFWFVILRTELSKTN